MIDSLSALRRVADGPSTFLSRITEREWVSIVTVGIREKFKELFVSEPSAFLLPAISVNTPFATLIVPFTTLFEISVKLEV